MVKKKKIWLIVGCLACLIALLLFVTLPFTNSALSEKKIAQYLYADQPTEAIREIKILLFFHPKNVYGIRMRDLLTSDDNSYP